jgi:hypothetical protein
MEAYEVTLLSVYPLLIFEAYEASEVTLMFVCVCVTPTP